MDQHRAGGVNRPGTDVAVRPLESVAVEHAAATVDVERSIDDQLGRLDGVVLGRDELRGSEAAMADAV
jgi:hypothetical protein